VALGGNHADEKGDHIEMAESGKETATSPVVCFEMGAKYLASASW